MSSISARREPGLALPEQRSRLVTAVATRVDGRGHHGPVLDRAADDVAAPRRPTSVAVRPVGVTRRDDRGEGRPGTTSAGAMA